MAAGLYTSSILPAKLPNPGHFDEFPCFQNQDRNAWKTAQNQRAKSLSSSSFTFSISSFWIAFYEQGLLSLKLHNRCRNGVFTDICRRRFPSRCLGSGLPSSLQVLDLAGGIAEAAVGVSGWAEGVCADERGEGTD